MLYSLFSELVTGPDWLHKYLTTEEFRLKTELGKRAHFRATAPLVHGRKVVSDANVKIQTSWQVARRKYSRSRIDTSLAQSLFNK